MDYNKMAQQLGSYATDPAATSYGVNPKTGMAKVKNHNGVSLADRMGSGLGGAGQFLGGLGGGAFGQGAPWGNDPQSAMQWAQGLKGQGLGVANQAGAPGWGGIGQQWAGGTAVPPGLDRSYMPSQAQGLFPNQGQAPMGQATMDPMRSRLMQGFRS
jgi:hypothetical protein